MKCDGAPIATTASLVGSHPAPSTTQHSTPNTIMRRALLPVLLLALPAALAAQGPLTPGRSATGTISTSDPKMADGTNYDEWTFTAKGHRRYRIAMNSEAFDAYLSIGQGRG